MDQKLNIDVLTTLKSGCSTWKLGSLFQRLSLINPWFIIFFRVYCLSKDCNIAPSFYQSNTSTALADGTLIFVTEWGTVNVNGGGCVLGHPIGASGTWIMATLIAEMEKRDAKTGMASLCIGGGEATAVCLRRD